MGGSGRAPRSPREAGSCPSDGSEPVHVCGGRTAMTRTAKALTDAGRPLRRRLTRLLAFAPIAVFVATLAVTGWGMRLGALRSPFYVPAAWAIGLGFAALVMTVLVRSRGRFTLRGVADQLESSG